MSLVHLYRDWYYLGTLVHRVQLSWYTGTVSGTSSCFTTFAFIVTFSTRTRKVFTQKFMLCNLYFDAIHEKFIIHKYSLHNLPNIFFQNSLLFTFKPKVIKKVFMQYCSSIRSEQNLGVSSSVPYQKILNILISLFTLCEVRKILNAVFEGACATEFYQMGPSTDFKIYI